jgi:hypothetical protein
LLNLKILQPIYSVALIKNIKLKYNNPNNYGNKYLDDISDSDEDDGMSYKKRNTDVINKLVDKTNSNIKQKIERKSDFVKDYKFL